LTCCKSQNLLSFRAVYSFLLLPLFTQYLTDFRVESTS
jgi:hypothetical protein